ncbi:MAG: hypothetical protein HQ522_23265 [Bacteroidetes bacterium]|nr:hypothetical protein [Bacteroidota bacterium]
MDGKTKAIVAHIFFIGWIIAFVINMGDKDEITSYYLRQTLILHLIMIVGWIPGLGNILALAALVFLVISLLSAIQNEKKELPFVGKYFQEWFSGF